MEINGVKIDKAVWRDAEKEHKRIIENKKKQGLKVGNERFWPYPNKVVGYFDKSLSKHLLNVVLDLVDTKENIAITDEFKTPIVLGDETVCGDTFNIASLKHIEKWSKEVNVVKAFLIENGVRESDAEQASKEQEETLTERLVRIVNTYARDYRENKEG